MRRIFDAAGGLTEASKGVVQEDVNFVLLVDERVVVVALGALDVALAGVVVEGRVSDAAALLAPQLFCILGWG